MITGNACMHVCMHARMYICGTCVGDHRQCMHACIYACMHACMYTCGTCIGDHRQCMHACIYACMHACMHACIHVVVPAVVIKGRDAALAYGAMVRFLLFVAPHKAAHAVRPPRRIVDVGNVLCTKEKRKKKKRKEEEKK